MTLRVDQYRVAFIVIVLLSLWDIYHVTYGKVFDISAFLIVIIYFLVYPRFRFDNPLFIFSWLPFMALGWFADPKAQIGIMMGMGFYFFFSSVKANLNGAIFSIICFIFACQLIDAVAFFGFGRVLSFYPDIFLEKRNYDGSSFFRPTGVFAEANAISVTMLMLLGSLDDQFNRFRKALVIVIISMAMSFSLFGMGAALLLIIQSLVARNSMTIILLTLLTLLTVVLIVSEGNISLPYLEIFTNRVKNLGDDPSAIARFGLNNNYGLDVFLPQGFTTKNSEGHYYAANGMLSLLYATGGFFPLLLLFYYRGANGPRGYLIYSLVLMSNPIYTSGLFWAFLAISFKRRAP